MKNEQQIIETNLLDFVNAQQQCFTVETAAEALHKKTNIELETVKKEVEALLEYHPDVFAAGDTPGSYLSRNFFFNKAKFIITPSPYEIEQGILIPGHRLFPFINQDVFPSEAKIADVNSKQFLNSKCLTISLEQISPYHILLGTEEMLNYFIAEDQNNSAIISQGDITQQISITVFDLKAFYKTFTFKSGDSLLLEVQDWHKGVLTLDFMPSEDKDNYDLKPNEWTDLFESSLLEVIDEFSDYITISDQLAFSLFKAGQALLKSPVVSIEEYQANTESVQLIIQNNHCTLAKYDEEDIDFDEMDIPEEVMISQGKTNSLDAILEEIKIPVKAVELESFMHDEFNKGGDSLDAVLQRAFGNEELAFIDAGQEAIFQNMLEELWESALQNYNRFSNKNKGYLRERILEITDTRIQWLRYLKEESIDTANVPTDEFRTLAECSARFSNMLQIMNRDQVDFADEDMEQLSEAIEEISDVQQNCINTINKVLLK